MKTFAAKRIVVASTNPVKIEATLAGFRAMFTDHSFSAVGVSVASGVSDQPRSDAETLLGAHNRVNAAYASCPEADFWVGIEGGVEERDDALCAFAWVVVRDRVTMASGKSGTFFLPPQVADLVKFGLELGLADDLVFDVRDSKRARGAVGLLTGGVIDRTSFYQAAVVLALIPLKNPRLYEEWLS